MSQAEKIVILIMPPIPYRENTKTGCEEPLISSLAYPSSSAAFCTITPPQTATPRLVTGALPVFASGSRYSAKEWITTPERSLGSNQVVFGGMMLPVSAMSINCCIETG